MEFDNYAVYVKANVDGYITDVHSSAFLNDLDGWVEIDSGNGDKYHHAQGHYFPYPIITDSGVWRFKLVDGVPTECTEGEIAEQEAALPPPAMSDKERIAELEAALELLLSGVTE